MGRDERDQSTLSVRVRIREFSIPPITDALVIGKKAPIGSQAMSRALSLLHVAPFALVPLEDDDVIEDVLVRTSVLNKIPQPKLLELVRKRIKPFMSADEVINLDVSPELTIEERL